MPYPNVLIGSEIAVWLSRAYIGIRNISVSRKLERRVNAHRVHGIFVVEIRGAGNQGIEVNAFLSFFGLQQNLYIRTDVFILFSCAGINHIRGGNVSVFFARLRIFPDDFIILLLFQHSFVYFDLKGEPVYGWAAL